MPCLDIRDDYSSGSVSAHTYSLLQDRNDLLARISCSIMEAWSNGTNRDEFLASNKEVADWWKEHQELDAKRRAKAEKDKELARIKRAAMTKLTEEEKIVLGLLKKSSRK